MPARRRTGELVRRLPGNRADVVHRASPATADRVATVSVPEPGGDRLGRRHGAGSWRSVRLGRAGRASTSRPDGSTLYTAGAGTALRHWDLDGDRRFLSAGCRPPSPARPASSCSQLVAAGTGWRASSPSMTSEQVVFFDVASGTSGELWLDRGKRLRPPASAAGTPTASTSPSPPAATIRIWDAHERASWSRRARIRSGRYISGVDYSTDGSRLVVARALRAGDHARLRPRWRRVGRPVRARSQQSAASRPGRTTARRIALTGRLDASGFFWHDHLRVGPRRPRGRHVV